VCRFDPSAHFPILQATSLNLHAAVRSRTLAIRLIIAADKASAAGQKEDAEAFAQIGVSLADLALGLTPGVGFAKDTYEALTGTSLLTGQGLSDLDRGFAVAGMVTGGLGGEIWKGLKVIGRLLSEVGETRAVAPILRGAQRILEVTRQYQFSLRVAKYGAGIPEDVSELEKLHIRLGREEIGSLFDSAGEVKKELISKAVVIDLKGG